MTINFNSVSEVMSFITFNPVAFVATFMGWEIFVLEDVPYVFVSNPSKGASTRVRVRGLERVLQGVLAYEQGLMGWYIANTHDTSHGYTPFKATHYVVRPRKWMSANDFINEVAHGELYRGMTIEESNQFFHKNYRGEFNRELAQHVGMVVFSTRKQAREALVALRKFHFPEFEIAPLGQRFLSWYMDERYYGGPEEGGWWGTANILRKASLHKQTSLEKAVEKWEKRQDEDFDREEQFYPIVERVRGNYAEGRHPYC